MWVRVDRLETKNWQSFWLFTILAVGIALRLVMPMRGSNYDMESYRIVADIVAKGGDVYAETNRYNYGPVWFHILHALDSLPWIAGDKLTALHWKVACFLTIVDIGICLTLFRSYGATVAALFFLNPISIMITGYHSQFENFAILVGLVSVGILDRQKGTRWMWLGLVLLGLSLSIKHILFLFPLWLAIKQEYWSRKLLFAGLPYVIFLAGFVPYLPRDAHQILKNVFLYRSWNNAPLWSDFAPGFATPRRRSVYVVPWHHAVSWISMANEEGYRKSSFVLDFTGYFFIGNRESVSGHLRTFYRHPMELGVWCIHVYRVCFLAC